MITMNRSLLITTRTYGFFSSLFQILDNIKYCEENSIKPIIKLNKTFVYNFNKENVWNDFFENINDQIVQGTPIEIESLPHTDRFLVENFLMVSPKNKNFRLKLWDLYEKSTEEFLQHRLEIHQFIQQYLRPKSDILIEMNSVPLDAEKNNLAVHIRGTDYNNNFLEKFIETTKHDIELNIYDKIFIASDNKEAIDTYKQKFNNVVFYNTTLRAETMNTKTPICYTTNGSDKIKQGKDVLVECLLLSKCSKLICVNSNVAAMATYFNPKMEVKLISRLVNGG